MSVGLHEILQVQVGMGHKSEILLAANSRKKGRVGVSFRLLLIDDYALLRGAMRDALTGRFGCECDEQASLDPHNHEWAKSLRQYRAVLLDLGITGFDGVESLRALREIAPEIATLVVTASTGSSVAKACRALGAQGLIHKTGNVEDLYCAVLAVTTGLTYWPSLTSVRELHTSEPGDRLSPKVTDRQAEVLKCLAQGMSNRTIANRLYISEGTVKTHVHHLLDLYKVTSRTELAARINQRAHSS